MFVERFLGVFETQGDGLERVLDDLLTGGDVYARRNAYLWDVSGAARVVIVDETGCRELVRATFGAGLWTVQDTGAPVAHS